MSLESYAVEVKTEATKAVALHSLCTCRSAAVVQSISNDIFATQDSCSVDVQNSQSPVTDANWDESSTFG